MISLITTYYNEPKHLIHLLESECSDVFDEIIIVDDGSKKYPASNVVTSFTDDRIKLFRIKDDLGFNSHGARNLAMKHCSNEWAYLTDIDRSGIGELASIVQRYVESARDKEYFKWYLSTEEQSINDYCIRVKDFWISGGYDEEFVNYHYGDKMFIERLDQYLYPTYIPYRIKPTRYARETKKANIKITEYPNDKTLIEPKRDKSRKQKIIDTVGWRNENPELWIRDNILQFDWEQLI